MTQKGKSGLHAPTAMVFMVLGFVTTLLVAHLYNTRSAHQPMETPSHVETEESRAKLDPKVNAIVGAHVEQIANSASVMQGLDTNKASEILSQSDDPTFQGIPKNPWKTLPRNRKAFEDIIVDGPLDADHLLRNSHCNPRDLEIPPENQELLKQYCESVGPQIRALHKAAASAAAGDLIHLMETGNSRVKTIRELDSKLSTKEKSTIDKSRDRIAATLAEKVGKTKSEVLSDPNTAIIAPRLHFKDHNPFAYAVSNGHVHSATANELPNASAALNGKEWACLEAASIITGFFSQHGCLEAFEAENLILRVLKKLENPSFGSQR